MRARLADIAILAVALAATNGRTTTPAPAPAAPAVAADVPHPQLFAEEAAHGLVVRVVADGKPAAGAEVSLADGGDDLPRVLRSDREGVVRIDELAPGAYELWATADGLASPVARIGDTDAPIELALAPASSVHGHAVADAAQVSGGSVQLVPLDGDRAVRTIALGEDGSLAIAGLPYGRWRVEASAPGFVQPGPQIVDIDARDTTLDVHLVRAGNVTGTVVDSHGNPVANATIVLAEQTRAVPPQRPLELAATGLRWVHPLAGARFLPVIDDARFGAPRPGPRPAECGRGHCGIDIGSERGSTVHAAADGEIAAVFAEPKTEAGRVVVIHHGRGLRSYYMHLDEIRPGLEVGQAIHAGDPVGTLGSTGFSRPLPHLHFAITYEAGGRTWYLDPEPIVRQAVVMAAPRAITPADATAAPAQLAATPVLHRITTDDQGQFRVEGVAPGTYAAGAFASDFAPGSSAPFVVTSGDDTTGVVVTMSAGMVVEGRVLGPYGPLDGATLMASAGFGETAHKVAMTSTDRHGEFTLRALGGKITLAVSAPGYGELERTITLDGGSHRREDFTLVIENAQLRGQVLAPEGGAAAGVVVRVVDGPTHRSGVTDAQGRFAIDHVASGHYTLELAGADTPAKRVAADSDRWTEIRLEAGGALRCLVRDAQSGSPVAGARVELTGAAGQLVRRAADAHGLVELRGLAAG
ncbi:MAG: carboxypeptidase regulatory-like domain-containing protein, partial [Acidobacteriota bacterium]